MSYRKKIAQMYAYQSKTVKATRTPVTDTAGVALVCQTHFTHILLKTDIFKSPLWVLMGHRYLEGWQPKKIMGNQKHKTGCPKGKLLRK